MISIRDYAEANSVTYEAIRKKLKQYEKELEGHLHKQGRTTFLDDAAVDFLEKHKNVNPIVVGDQQQLQEVNRLRDENDNLKDKIINFQENWQKVIEEKHTLELENLSLNNRLEGAVLQKENELKEEFQSQKEELEKKYREEIDGLKKELDMERNKKWYQKIFRGEKNDKTSR